MDQRTDGPRWKIWLPLAAAVAAVLMIALSLLTHRTMIERNELALEGRLLGLAHSVETALRETGVASSREVLESLLADGGGEVVGLSLVDGSGEMVVAVGQTSADNRVRSVNLFLGRFAGGNDPPQRQNFGPPAVRGMGRGRFELQLHIDSMGSALPVAARLLVPTAAVAGIALVWLAALAGRFLERQRTEIREIAERRRLEALARAGAGLAHQLRTPLATIKGTSQLMGELCDRKDLAPRLETVISQADRMNRLLGRLLDYARPPIPEPQLVDIADIIGETTARHPGVEFRVAETTTAFVDREHLVEILDNLLANATFFAPEGEPVVVRAFEEDDEVRVVVGDRGPGPGENPELHFEPYQTSRADGTGLGLPIARALAEANGGSLILTSAPGGGCEAVLSIPRETRRP